MVGLGTGPFWDLVGPIERKALENIGQVRYQSTDSVIFVERDGCRQVSVLLEGLLKLTKATGDGRETLLEIRGRGDVIGELSAVDDEPRSATGTVVVDAKLLVIPVDAFRSALLEYPMMSRAVMCTLAQRLREASERQLEMGTSDALARVCRRLVELAQLLGVDIEAKTVVFHSPISQQGLAEWAGVSRDAVVRSLKTLRTLDLIATGRNRYEILDYEALRARSIVER